MHQELIAEFPDVRQNLDAVMRFLLSSTAWFGERAAYDIQYDMSADRLTVKNRVPAIGPNLQRRFDFWCALSGGSSGPQKKGAPAAKPTGKMVNLDGLTAKAFAAGLKRVVTLSGAPHTNLPRAELVFNAKLFGDNAAVVKSVSDTTFSLFVSAARAPAVGDMMAVRLHFSDGHSVTFDAIVTSVVRKPTPVEKVGFTVSPRTCGKDLLAKLKLIADRMPRGAEQRVYERVPVRAPVVVRPIEVVEKTVEHLPELPVLPKTPPRERARVQLAYASDEQFSADYTQNLSKGGAFIMTDSPLPVETEVMLELALPHGLNCMTKATVVHVGNGGMGVQFHLDEASEAVLDKALVRLMTPPKRAIVIGGCDATTPELVKRGYDVVYAADVDAGLEALVDAPFDVEMVIASSPDVFSLARFVHIVRQGGLRDVAIVMVAEDGARAGFWMGDANVDFVSLLSSGPEAIVQDAIAAAARHTR